jgi:hypothetical protein
MGLGLPVEESCKLMEKSIRGELTPENT